jgi:hypothetical protein
MSVWNIDNLTYGLVQAAANGFAMYWGVKLATRIDKTIKTEKKDDTKQDGAGVKSQDDRNDNTVNRGDRNSNV